MKRRELHTSAFGHLAFAAYRCPSRQWQRVCAVLITRMEHGQFYSATLRRIFDHYHGVKVGAYSYGGCFVPGAFPAGASIGRYVSVAAGVKAFRRNHPMDWLSMHPFFYNPRLGVVENDVIESAPLEIGHDAWVGERTLIMPGCSRIGIGAVVGAGSVVTRDVPDFAIAAGNPARIIRYRFSEDVQKAVLESRWWEMSVRELREHKDAMQFALGSKPEDHPVIRACRGSL